MKNRIPHFLFLALSLGALPLIGCSATPDSVSSSASEALSSGVTITSALVLGTSTVSSGQTVQATVTYQNGGAEPVVVQAVAIAARPPGGSHAGGPYEDFQPYATARTLAPGESLTVNAARSFTSADATGAWDVYSTFEDGDGVWHDGPDVPLGVGVSSGAGCDAGTDPGAPTPAPPVPGATSGSWQSGNINGMSYQFLMPAEYDAARAYPLVLYLHQLDNASQIPTQIDPWFNNEQFRSNHPAIIIAPQCDQSADPSGNTINWGGVSNASQPCQENAIALVDRFMSTYSVFAPKVYVTGNSMGGIGSWDLILKYNTKSPTVRPLFAATLILAGATYAWGYPDPDAALVQRMKDVPIWAIHGGGDTQVPLDWDRNMFAAEQATGGAMRLLVDPGLSHDVWDTYYVSPTAETYWTWLFAQSR